MGKDLLIVEPFLYPLGEIASLRWFFWLFYTRERKTINESILKERSLLTEVLSSNPSFGLNPLETKSHNLILATVTLKAGYTGLILVLERALKRSSSVSFVEFSLKRLRKRTTFLDRRVTN